MQIFLLFSSITSKYRQLIRKNAKRPQNVAEMQKNDFNTRSVLAYFSK